MARAKALVPAATFVQGDMTEISFPPGSFAAVVCLYALIHVPVAEHREMLRRISLWLRPVGAALLTTVGEHATAGTERDWLGVEGATMYWSHAEWPTYKTWFTDLGFAIVHDDFVGEDDGGHHFVLVRRAARN